MRRQGISKQLLDRVCQDAAREGFDFVEAYPEKEYASDAIDFMGPYGLFRKCGFAPYSETKDKRCA